MEITQERAVRVLAIAFTVLVIADSLITYWAVNHGYVELNFFIAPIAHTWYLAVCKSIASLVVAGLAIWTTERFSKIWPPALKVLTFGLIFPVVFMSFVVISDLILIWF